MKPNVLQNLDKLNLPKKDKEAVKCLIAASNNVSFGKIAPRQDGYIMGDMKCPRCTSVLQMDGSKAGALMEWAKRQVAGKIENILCEKLAKYPLSLTEFDIINACQEGLMDPDRQKDEAADKGTTVHDNIENYLTGYPYQVNEPLERFKASFAQANAICVATEIPLLWHDAEKKEGFGGRMDLLLYKDGKFWIGDNKTSKSVHESYGCQVAAYKYAIEQMTKGKMKIAGGMLFHIPDLKVLNERQKKEYDKRGSLVYLKDLKDAFEHYRLLLGLYYRRNNKYF